MTVIERAKTVARVSSAQRFNSLIARLKKHGMLYLLMLPGIIYYLIFRYGTIYGIVIAFKDFQILKGILGSPWVGFKHFRTVFGSPVFGRILRNTLMISSLKLVFGFFPPIILALLLNEVRLYRVKSFIQTVSALPHFLSWVIVSGIVLIFLSPSGLVNQWVKASGGQVIPFLTNDRWFIAVLILSQVWKEVGWGAIIYLAALTGINPELYEAAIVDGANRLQRMWYISIPGIQSVIVLMLTLRLGYIMHAGFEQIYILYNPQVYEVADIIDTWVFRNGIEQFRFSLAAAAGVFQSAVGMTLLLLSNYLAKRWTDYSIW